MKCGVYKFTSAAGRTLYYRLSEEFARARPWYDFVRDCECNERVRFDSGEAMPPAPPQPTPMRGLGDLVASGIKLITFGTLQPCGGCQQRQEFLNRIVPFGSSRHANSH